MEQKNLDWFDDLEDEENLDEIGPAQKVLSILVFVPVMAIILKESGIAGYLLWLF